MSVKVRLNNGAEFVLKTSMDDFMKKVQVALDNDRFLEVENDGGTVRVINPAQISYAEELDADYAEAVEEALAS